MPIFLKGAFDVLTSKPVALLAEAAVVALAIALLVARVEIAVQSRQLTVATSTISQLKGSLYFQNQMVSQLGAESAAAKKRATAAAAASRAAHTGDAAQVAALLAAPVPSDPAAACERADQSIREFFK